MANTGLDDGGDLMESMEKCNIEIAEAVGSLGHAEEAARDVCGDLQDVQSILSDVSDGVEDAIAQLDGVEGAEGALESLKSTASAAAEAHSDLYSVREHSVDNLLSYLGTLEDELSRAADHAEAAAEEHPRKSEEASVEFVSTWLGSLAPLTEGNAVALLRSAGGTGLEEAADSALQHAVNLVAELVAVDWDEARHASYVLWGLLGVYDALAPHIEGLRRARAAVTAAADDGLARARVEMSLLENSRRDALSGRRQVEQRRSLLDSRPEDEVKYEAARREFFGGNPYNSGGGR